MKRTLVVAGIGAAVAYLLGTESGRAKLDDEIVELEEWDEERVGVVERGVEGGQRGELEGGFEEWQSEFGGAAGAGREVPACGGGC